jgi:branched-chain amino acid aminotransferase
MTEAGPEPLIWVNGEPQKVSDPHVSVLDRGFMLADGVFETMRVHRGVVFRLDDHLSRLETGLATLGIPAPPSLRDWVLLALPGFGSGPDASIRVTVTRGPGSPGVALNESGPRGPGWKESPEEPGGVGPQAVIDDARPTVVVMLSSMPVFPRAVYDEGLSAHVVAGRRNEHAMTAGLKTLAYTDSVVALLEARRAGAHEALFLDTEAHCSEASSSNLFVWTGSGLVTPPTSCGALRGITRAAVLEIARGLGMRADERVVTLDELFAAGEAFMTSSLRGVAPLVRVDGRTIGAGTPGEVTRRLSREYTDLVDRECGA